MTLVGGKFVDVRRWWVWSRSCDDLLPNGASEFTLGFQAWDFHRSELHHYHQWWCFRNYWLSVIAMITDVRLVILSAYTSRIVCALPFSQASSILNSQLIQTSTRPSRRIWSWAHGDSCRPFWDLHDDGLYPKICCHRNNKGNFAISNPSSNGSDGYVSLKWTLQVVVCQPGAKNLPFWCRISKRQGVSKLDFK